MKKLIITAAAMAALIPLGGCADDHGYSSGYYNPYNSSGYYSSYYYDNPTYYRRYYNGYNWPY